MFDNAKKENKELETLITTNYIEVLDPNKALSIFEQVRAWGLQGRVC